MADRPLNPRDRRDLAQARLAEIRADREAGLLMPLAEAVSQMRALVAGLAARLRHLDRHLVNRGLPPAHAPLVKAWAHELLDEIANWKLADAQRAAKAEEAGSE